MRKFLRWLIRLVLGVIARIQVRGREKVPAQGAFVLATNHLGFIDLAMFYYVFERFDIFIPVAEKWEKTWWGRFLARELNFVFVDRFNPDLKALRKMMALMDAGNALVIAPEGTRSRAGSLLPGRPGVAYLAARSGFPVVPVAITGTQDRRVVENLRHLRKTDITLTAGEPFFIAPLPKNGREPALQAASDEIMCRIAALLPPEYRGVYSDHPRLKELLQTLPAG